jgi:pilus assembly protein CpaE
LTAPNVIPINLAAVGAGSAAPLVAFVRDEETHGALVTALGADWPAATIQIGGVNEAVVHLAGDPSARILIVDFAQCPDMFNALDRLAEVCTPGTLVIALGEVNDVTLYRRLRAAGIADYLVKPVTA